MKKEAMSGLSPVGFNDLRVSRMPVLFLVQQGQKRMQTSRVVAESCQECEISCSAVRRAGKKVLCKDTNI